MNKLGVIPALAPYGLAQVAAAAGPEAFFDKAQERLSGIRALSPGPKRPACDRLTADAADQRQRDLREALSRPRLERATGVIYRPETELYSHYFEAVLPEQFDAYVWFEETRAATPLPTARPEGVPETYPFGV